METGFCTSMMHEGGLVGCVELRQVSISSVEPIRKASILGPTSEFLMMKSAFGAIPSWDRRDCTRSAELGLTRIYADPDKRGAKDASADGALEKFDKAWARRARRFKTALNCRVVEITASGEVDRSRVRSALERANTCVFSSSKTSRALRKSSGPRSSAPNSSSTPCVCAPMRARRWPTRLTTRRSSTSDFPTATDSSCSRDCGLPGSAFPF